MTDNDSSRVRLTLYGRAWCHLCDDMLKGLAAVVSGFDFVDVEVIDVDGDPGLVTLYDELVPVLVADGQELCHYHLDVAKVREYLSRFG